MQKPPQYEEFLAHYTAFYEKILNYVFYRTGRDLQLAEDLTQEIFMKALERYDSYDNARAFQAWLYTIARNHLTDFYRKRRERVSYDTLENVLTTEEDVPADIDQRRLVKRVVVALSQLTDSEQELITLRYIQELTTEEIADILGKKSNAIYVGLHRAVKKLRSLMDGAQSPFSQDTL